MSGTALLRTAVILFFVLCTAIFTPVVCAEVVDHIIAAVNYEVITASELAQVAALNERIGNAEATAPDVLLSQTLDGLIARRLLVQEARRLKFVEISDQEIGTEVIKLRKRFSSDAAFVDFMRSQNIAEQELYRLLGERLLVERFVEKKVGLFVRVGRDEAQAYFDAHTARFPGKRFQDVQKSIIAALTEQKVGQQLDLYVAELRSKAEIRINRSEAGLK